MSKLSQARAQTAKVRKQAKESETMATVGTAAAGAAYGYAEREGMYLPSIPKVGRHATTGALSLLAASVVTNRQARQALLSVGRAGITIASYNLGRQGETVAGVDEIGYGDDDLDDDIGDDIDEDDDLDDDFDDDDDDDI